MKLIYIFILSINLSFSAETKLADQKEFQDSTFVKLMNILNNGKIPYPFSNLLDSFQIGVRETGNILFVPKGRSLVKESADYRNPRIIVEPFGVPAFSPTERTGKEEEWKKNKKNLIEKINVREGDLFIGYAPTHKALEIISYNPKKLANDFFIVTDYEEGKNPKIVSDPAQCLGCHQNEAPLFSKFPWHELVGATADSNNRMELFSGNNELMDKIREANPDREEIEGISLDKKTKKRFSFNDVGVFDIAVRRANDLMIKTKVCETLCKMDDRKCQLTLLSMVLNKNLNYEDYPYFKNSENKFNQITLASSALADRDPHTNTAFIDLLKKSQNDSELPAFIKGLSNSVPLSQDEFIKQVTSNGYDTTFSEASNASLTLKLASKEEKYINPAGARPQNSSLEILKFKVKNAESFNEKIDLIAQACLPDFLHNSPPNNVLSKADVKGNLSDWPLLRKLETILSKEEQNSLEPTESDCWDKQIKIANPIPVSVIKAVEQLKDENVKKPEALFGKYCIQCHGGATPFIPLPLNSAKDMADYRPKFGTTNVLERLERKIMPPRGAPQPSEKERAKLVQLIKELK